MSQSSIDIHESVESLPNTLSWSASDNISPRSSVDMMNYANFFCAQDTETNDFGWMTDLGVMFASDASHSPAQSSDCYQGPASRSSRYQPSPRTDDDVSVETAMINKERRRAQNKRAQQAFRRRKDTKLQELETQVTELKADLRQVLRKYSELQSEHLRLQSGLSTLLTVNLGVPDDFAAMSKALEKEIG